MREFILLTWRKYAKGYFNFGVGGDQQCGDSADGVKAVTSDPVDIYVEPASIKQAGNKMKIWELHNYDSLQELNGKRVLSLKTQTEYDCEKERFRSLAGVGYARKMGEGDVRFTDNEPDKWAPVVPGTIGEES